MLLGATALAAGAGLTEIGPAEAGPRNRPLGAGGHDVAIGATLASAPVSGYVYRYLTFFDFTPDDPDARMLWSDAGVSVDGAISTLWGSMEVPPGSRVAEIEWYYRNESAIPLFGRGRLWGAGLPGLDNTVLDLSLPIAKTLAARRGFVQVVNSGPYPPGVRLALGFDSGGKAYLNGVRVGFSNGGGVIGMLSTAVRAYDSRTAAAGKFTAQETRTITLPATVAKPGSTAVVVNLTAVGATTAGYLRAYRADGIVPQVSSINYSGNGAAIANGLVVGVSAGRQIEVYASSSVHVVIDVAGTIG